MRHPVVRAGEATTAFLTEYPPLSRAAGAAAGPAVARSLAAQSGTSRTCSPARAPTEAHDHGPGHEQSSLTAPMPGTVIRVLVAEGETVQPRQPLLVLEAMKMETPLTSPYEAVVQKLHVSEGDRVEGGALLLELEE